MPRLINLLDGDSNMARAAVAKAVGDLGYLLSVQESEERYPCETVPKVVGS